MVKARFSTLLFFLLIVHLAISFVFIFNPPFLSSTTLSKIYKTYLLPGPFFTDARIIDNYSLWLSWRVNGTWVPPINPARADFNLYHSSLNPTTLYKSRLNRTFYLRLALRDSSITYVRSQKEFHQFTQYLNDHYVQREADSVRMWIVNKQAAGFALKSDSVFIAFAR